MDDTILSVAKTACAIGLSVVYPMENGSKRPGVAGGEWKSYQTNAATPDEIQKWYGPRTGIGLITGAVSSGLELFEFDDREVYERFKEAAQGLGYGYLVESIESSYLEETPNGGMHWFYFVDDIRGSTKLASRPGRKDEGGKTLIETKGEGGFVIIAPTHGNVHPSGKPYRCVQGSLKQIRAITRDERDWLWNLARTFNEEPIAESRPERAPNTATLEWDDTTRPGDDYEARTTWTDILSGWKKVHDQGGTQYWRRPGKETGHSATVNKQGTDHLHVFSSSTEFANGGNYSRFGAFAVLNHKGNYEAAAKWLYENGYGTHKRWVNTDKGWVLKVFQNPCPKGNRIANPGEPSPDKKDPGKVYEEGELDALSDADLGLVNASSVDPESIDWEWPDRIARGKMTLLAGEGGDGKSQIAIGWVATITSGGRFPGSVDAVAPGKCLILAAEDGAKDTIIPRLIAAGADRDKVIIDTAKLSIKGKDGKVLIHPVSFQDLDRWRVVLSRHKIRLVVADPVPAYLGRGVNDHRNNEVRAVLEPFVDLANELGVAFVAITHVNKSSDQKSPTGKILGSVAYTNLARVVYCTYRDPDDKDRRILAMLKANICAIQDALAFRVISDEFEYGTHSIKTSKVVYEDSAFAFDATAHLEGEQGVKRGRPAVVSMKDAEWLWDHLHGVGWMPLARLMEFAGEEGWLGAKKDDGKWSSTTRLYRAKERLDELPGNKAGFTVDEERMPFMGRGKVCTHWKLSGVDSPIKEEGHRQFGPHEEETEPF